MYILFNSDVDYILNYSNKRSLWFSIINVLLNNSKKVEKENESVPTSSFKYFLFSIRDHAKL